VLSVTLEHPAEAVGENEMPFDRDTHVASSNIVLYRSPSSSWEGELGSRTSVCSDATYHQITLTLVVVIVIITIIIIMFVIIINVQY